MDRQPHAAVEHRRPETAVHGAGRVKMDFIRPCCDNDAPTCRLAHVVAQSFRHLVQGQRPIGEPLNELQAAHRLLPFGADGPITSGGSAAWHWLTYGLLATNLSFLLPN